MCVVAFAWNAHPRWRLLLAGLALRPAIGWPLMMGLLAFACVLAAVLGMAAITPAAFAAEPIRSS